MTLRGGDGILFSFECLFRMQNCSIVIKKHVTILKIMIILYEFNMKILDTNFQRMKLPFVLYNFVSAEFLFQISSFQNINHKLRLSPFNIFVYVYKDKKNETKMQIIHCTAIHPIVVFPLRVENVEAFRC